MVCDVKRARAAEAWTTRVVAVLMMMIDNVLCSKGCIMVCGVLS